MAVCSDIKRRVEHSQREATDRTCDAAAVRHQVLERVVRLADDIHLTAIDELAERRKRDGQPLRRIGERNADRVVGEVGGAGRAGLPASTAVWSSCVSFGRTPSPMSSTRRAIA